MVRERWCFPNNNSCFLSGCYDVLSRMSFVVIRVSLADNFLEIFIILFICTLIVFFLSFEHPLLKVNGIFGGLYFSPSFIYCQFQEFVNLNIMGSKCFFYLCHVFQILHGRHCFQLFLYPCTYFLGQWAIFLFGFFLDSVHCNRCNILTIYILQHVVTCRNSFNRLQLLSFSNPAVKALILAIVCYFTRSLGLDCLVFVCSGY